jgi:aryl-alcohol dehydrogenase
MKIKAAIVWETAKPFSIEEVDLEGPGNNEVLIRNIATGICHTDVAAQTQAIPVPLPAVLGHEGSGIVEETGKYVTGLERGDHVIVSYSFCGECPFCIAGRYTLCDQLERLNFGGRMRDGSTRLSKDGKPLSVFFGQSSFAAYSVVNRLSVVKIDPDIDLAMAAPLGCGIQAGAGVILNCFKPGFGTSLAVFGCGAVGMSAIMAGRLAGCSRVIAVGGNAKSLELALQMGATDTVNQREVSDIPAAIRDSTKGGADFAFDSSGVTGMIKTALKSLRAGGTFCTAGGPPNHETLSFGDLQGARIISANGGDAISRIFIPQMLDYYKMGRFPFDRMITYYDFADINKAAEESGAGKVIKAVCRFSD